METLAINDDIAFSNIENFAIDFLRFISLGDSHEFPLVSTLLVGMVH
jgi:hypothetical protein